MPVSHQRGAKEAYYQPTVGFRKCFLSVHSRHSDQHVYLLSQATRLMLIGTHLVTC